MDAGGFVSEFVVEFWMILTESAVWLLLGLVFAGGVHVLIPKGWVSGQLSGRGVGPILKASLLGVPLPLCSCAVIPVAAGLRGAGASKGASASFAISTPQTGEESIPLTWALFGPVFALTRPVVSVVTAFCAGLLIERFAGDGEAAGGSDESAGGAGGCCGGGEVEMGRTVSLSVLTGESADSGEPADGGSCCGGGGAEKSDGLVAKVRAVVEHGFGTMLTDLAPWLLAGFVLSALIAAAVPEGWIGGAVSSDLAQMGLVLLISLPVYVCATSSTPLAFTLAATAGLSPGAALVLLLAGPATNTATMAWVLKDLGVRALAIYVVTIAVLSVAAGLAFNASLASFVTLGESVAGEGSAVWLRVLMGSAGGLLLAMIVWGSGVRAVRGLR